jgi:DNA-binding NarL/FixJ family response regulator
MKCLVILGDGSNAQTIRRALRQTAGLDVVGFVDGCGPSQAQLLALRPDVVLVDDMQKPGDTLERLREASNVVPGAKRLLLTVSMEHEWLEDAFDAGADAVLCKTIQPVALATLVRETVRSNVVHPFRRGKSDGDCPLTSREMEILSLAAQGYTNGRIARELWIAEQTVKFHLSNTYRKLGVTNRTEASRYAYRQALAAPEGRLAS